jgi:hypothetical protein
MAITTALTTSFKSEVLDALHDFNSAGTNTFKLGLFKQTVTGTYGAASTNYSDVTGNSDEVANGNGYTTGGYTLTNLGIATSGTTAYVDFSDATWGSSTIDATVTAWSAFMTSAARNQAPLATLSFNSQPQRRVRLLFG